VSERTPWRADGMSEEEDATALVSEKDFHYFHDAKIKPATLKNPKLDAQFETNSNVGMAQESKTRAYILTLFLNFGHSDLFRISIFC
jgi:hypothetical protein